MTVSPIFCSNLRNRRNPSNSNYHVSISICQAIQNSCIDRKSNVWFTLGSVSESLVSLGQLPITVFKLLNDQQYEFREAILQYVNREVSSDPNESLAGLKDG